MEASTPRPRKAMSQEQLKGFLEAVAADATLQEQLKAAADTDAVVEVAKASGFVVSAEELEALALQVQAEISDEDLQGVAGGLSTNEGFGNVLITGGLVLGLLAAASVK